MIYSYSKFYLSKITLAIPVQMENGRKVAKPWIILYYITIYQYQASKMSVLEINQFTVQLLRFATTAAASCCGGKFAATVKVCSRNAGETCIRTARYHQMKMQHQDTVWST